MSRFHKLAAATLLLAATQAIGQQPSMLPPPSVPPLGYVWRTQEDWACVDSTLNPDKAIDAINSARQLHPRAEPYAFTVVTQGGKTCYIWAWRSLNKQ